MQESRANASHSHPSGAGKSRRDGTRNNRTWYWLLALPYVAMLWLPSYNRIEPRAFGVPFFYWYQLLWVVLSTFVIVAVLYLAHARKESDEHKR